MHQYAEIQNIQAKSLISESTLTFYSYNLTMLGKVGLRRNDFLFFKTEHDIKEAMRLL